MIYSRLPSQYRVKLEDGYTIISVSDRDCFFKSLLMFFRHVPNTVMRDEELVEESVE